MVLCRAMGLVNGVSSGSSDGTDYSEGDAALSAAQHAQLQRRVDGFFNAGGATADSNGTAGHDGTAGGATGSGGFGFNGSYGVGSSAGGAGWSPKAAFQRAAQAVSPRSKNRQNRDSGGSSKSRGPGTHSAGQRFLDFEELVALFKQRWDELQGSGPSNGSNGSNGSSGYDDYSSDLSDDSGDGAMDESKQVKKCTGSTVVQ
jgi:hypothetical protein